MNLNIPTLIIQVVSFLILVWFLGKILYKPLLEFLDKRSESINTMIEETKRNQKTAEANLEKSEDTLIEVKNDILKLKDKTQRQIDEQRKETLEEAKKQAKHIMARSKEDIERQKEEVKEEIKKEIGRLSIGIAERIISKEIKTTDHERLIQEAIKGLKEDR